ncbi:hypothetical protein ACFWN1_14615 [Streptomyces sp. NPDC058459]|uniref:hypothetical protein n=1 Tax=Streptomyces sp. NPDC058459 TaxID=3346508 RepID=UPI0036461DA4
MNINVAVAEALDAIGDDDTYSSARARLLDAERLLQDGTTVEAQRALDAAIAEIDAACPL